MICTKPDKDCPELVCGNSLPCPYHTVIINTDSEPPTITIPITEIKKIDSVTLGRLKEIARDFIKENHEES